MMLKEVIHRQFISHKCARPGEGCVRHKLSCGHEVVRKKSYGNPARMHCQQCADDVIENVPMLTDDATFESNGNAFGDK